MPDGYRRYGEAPRITTPDRMMTDEQIDRFIELFHDSFKGLMKEAALRSRDNAVSHRRPEPFKVGAAVMGINNAGEARVYSGHNITPAPARRTGWEKMCAESNALFDALESESSLIAAIVTVSTEVSTGDEKEHDALHPCRDCRDKLRELLAKGVLHRKSVIVNMNDKKERQPAGADRTEEERTVEQLLDQYKDDLKDGLK